MRAFVSLNGERQDWIRSQVASHCSRELTELNQDLRERFTRACIDTALSVFRECGFAERAIRCGKSLADAVARFNSPQDAA